MVSRILQLFLLLPVSLIFIGCSGSGSSSTYNPDVGPFDEDGNYVEAWADNPPKRGSDLRKTEPKAIAKVAPTPAPAPAPISRPVTVAVAPAPVAAPIPVAVPRPVLLPQPVAVTAPVAPQPVVTAPVAPRPVVTAPRTIRHVVKRGDTLFGLSRRYGKSVSAIKRANGISGSTIITGRSYIIPQ